MKVNDHQDLSTNVNYASIWAGMSEPQYIISENKISYDHLSIYPRLEYIMSWNFVIWG